MCFSPKENFLDLSIFSLWKHCIYNITTPLSSCVYWSYGYQDQITFEAFNWSTSTFFKYINTRIVQTKPHFGSYHCNLGSQVAGDGLTGAVCSGFSDQDWAFKANVLFALSFCPLVHLVGQSWWTHARFVWIKLIVRMSAPNAPTC